jgi:hypothetical protein
VGALDALVRVAGALGERRGTAEARRGEHDVDRVRPGADAVGQGVDEARAHRRLEVAGGSRSRTHASGAELATT